MATPVLEMPAEIRNAILERAREGAPEEICGVLGGRFGRTHSQVRSQYPVENAADRPQIRYRIDPETALEVFDRLEDRGEEIVGFYHSHPHSPLEPSETDQSLATWPDRSYVIVALEDDGPERTARVGAWRWRASNGGRFVRERIERRSE